MRFDADFIIFGTVIQEIYLQWSASRCIFKEAVQARGACPTPTDPPYGWCAPSFNLSRRNSRISSDYEMRFLQPSVEKRVLFTILVMEIIFDRLPV